MIANGPLFTTNWDFDKYELRTDGTLWATTPFSGSYGKRALGAAASRSAGDPTGFRCGATYQTMIGLTSDGTLWTWGLDYGQESHWVQVFGARN